MRQAHQMTEPSINTKIPLTPPCTRTYTHACTHTHMYTHTHAHCDTHTHAHTHTDIHSRATHPPTHTHCTYHSGQFSCIIYSFEPTRANCWNHLLDHASLKSNLHHKFIHQIFNRVDTGYYARTWCQYTYTVHIPSRDLSVAIDTRWCGIDCLTPTVGANRHCVIYIV